MKELQQPKGVLCVQPIFSMILLAVGAGVSAGVLFLLLGALLDWLNFGRHDALEMFLTGFACASIAAIVGLMTDHGRVSDPVRPTL